MSEQYESFLICFHGERAEVYNNGLPLGIVSNNKFTPHERIMPNGTVLKRETRIELIRKVDDVLCAITERIK